MFQASFKCVSNEFNMSFKCFSKMFQMCFSFKCVSNVFHVSFQLHSKVFQFQMNYLSVSLSRQLKILLGYFWIWRGWAVQGTWVLVGILWIDNSVSSFKIWRGPIQKCCKITIDLDRHGPLFFSHFTQINFHTFILDIKILDWKYALRRKAITSDWQ